MIYCNDDFVFANSDYVMNVAMISLAVILFSNDDFCVLTMIYNF